jgi:hypothetical protein
MKPSFPRHFVRFLSLAAGTALTLSAALADQTWNGGSGQWDVGTTADWNTNQTWSEGYDTGTGTFTNSGDGALFTSAGGTVTVDDSQSGGSVGTRTLYFNNNNNGAYTLTGDTIYTDTGTNGTLVELDGNSGAVTIDNTIDHEGGDLQSIDNFSASTLTLNGNLIYNNQSTLFTNTNANSTIVFNGAVQQAQASGLYLEGSGTVEFTANSDMTSLDSGHNGNNLSLIVSGGSAVLDADTFLSTSQMEFLGGNGIFTNGAFIVGQHLTDERSSAMTLGGEAAVSSGWSGTIYLDNNPGTVTFSQVADGTYTYSGNIYGANSTSLATSGAGTVVFSSANSYYGNNTLAADLNATTTLITNTSGSAFGTNTGVVQVEAGKTLGGTGISTQQVVGMDKTSIIAPGVDQYTTLQLYGGLKSAANGLTMNFTIDSNGNGNSINLQYGGLTLTGTITLNFTSADGGVKTDNGYDNSGYAYTLIQGVSGGVWDTSSATIDIVAPAGYAVNTAYGTNGYYFNDGSDDGNAAYSETAPYTLTVEFVAAPEPSTYALILGGVVLLAVGVRRSAKRAC